MAPPWKTSLTSSRPMPRVMFAVEKPKNTGCHKTAGTCASDASELTPTPGTASARSGSPDSSGAARRSSGHGSSTGADALAASKKYSLGWKYVPLSGNAPWHAVQLGSSTNACTRGAARSAVCLNARHVTEGAVAASASADAASAARSAAAADSTHHGGVAAYGTPAAAGAAAADGGAALPCAACAVWRTTTGTSRHIGCGLPTPLGASVAESQEHTWDPSTDTTSQRRWRDGGVCGRGGGGGRGA
eukprot:115885-Chlamydomonas_euryale.AAC.2